MINECFVRVRVHVLDTEESVVLGHTLTSGRSTSLDLAGTESDDEIGDEGILGLARTVRDHDTPSVGLCELSSVAIFSIY
jgi:hypothetical protein